MSVYVCACESVGASKSRGGENTHSRSVHPSVSVGSVLITETQSHMKVISIFVERVCVQVCVLGVQAGVRDNVRHSMQSRGICDSH